MAKQSALPQTQRSLIAPHPRTRATGENVDFTVPEIRVGCVVWQVRFQGSFRKRNLGPAGVSRQKRTIPELGFEGFVCGSPQWRDEVYSGQTPSVGDHKNEGRFLVDRGENLLLSKLVPRIKRTNRLADALSENCLVLTNSMENKVMRTTWFKVVFLGCLLASLPAYAQRPAIFYVADPTALNAADQAAFDRLTALGFSVTAIDDNLSDPADATGQQ